MHALMAVDMNLKIFLCYLCYNQSVVVYDASYRLISQMFLRGILSKDIYIYI